MSFFVYFNDQFSPYIYKTDPTPPYKTRSVEQLLPLKAQTSPDSKDENKTKLEAYQKQATTFEKSKIRLQARDIMSSPLHSIEQSEPVSRAIDVMGRMGFRHMPVLDNSGNFIGLLSQKDVLSAPPNQIASQIMQPQVIVALDSSRIQDVAHLMLDEKLNALPVINYQHKLLGMITLSDILKFVINMDEFKI